MAYKIFIDGKDGTTGLKIYERFKNRADLVLLQCDDAERKNPAARRTLINESDVTFLCLPDDAAQESVALCTNERTRIIDASTAHRTTAGWVYGFPELSPQFRKAIAAAKRVAVPGCYASGFNALCYPLVQGGIIPRDYPVVCQAVSGYSGGGKKAIAQYETPNRPTELDTPRLYALSQQHKHVPEMQKISGLQFAPAFMPYICNYFSGMTVTVALHTRLLATQMTAYNVWEFLSLHYSDARFVRVVGFMGTDILTEPFIPANSLAGTNMMRIFVSGNDERVILTAQFDNLGKGASGAAVQCLNILLGLDESTGLV
ncbi:MAG: N-acetyl-gamma-glutamyl-phosphate reductase [Treponema sp.]|nr:N-acetyl-gamma-glutamyl-phosphate reductase [Treponema sp.]